MAPVLSFPTRSGIHKSWIPAFAGMTRGAGPVIRCKNTTDAIMSQRRHKNAAATRGVTTEQGNNRQDMNTVSDYPVWLAVTDSALIPDKYIGSSEAGCRLRPVSRTGLFPYSLYAPQSEPCGTLEPVARKFFSQRVIHRIRPRRIFLRQGFRSVSPPQTPHYGTSMCCNSP